MGTRSWSGAHRTEDFVRTLQAASETSQCRVRGFHDMAADEVAALCGLPLDQAILAKQREYDEPFLILDVDRAAELAAAIEARDCRCLQAGRFCHISSAQDKAAAVRSLADAYAEEHGTIRTIGLGGGWNDVGFLNVVAHPAVEWSACYGWMRDALTAGEIAAVQPSPGLYSVMAAAMSAVRSPRSF